MIDLNEAAKKAYNCAIRREKITIYHGFEEFMKDLASEFTELATCCPKEKKNISYELADVILVCMSIASGYGIDIEKAIKDKMKYNEER